MWFFIITKYEKEIAREFGEDGKIWGWVFIHLKLIHCHLILGRDSSCLVFGVENSYVYKSGAVLCI